ncbi:MAG: GIY-YIG nuclease family protein [Phenylobacterium sp.]
MSTAKDRRRASHPHTGVKMLVWYEVFPTADEAISSEKRIKRWRRQWKLELIEKMNPLWLDLYLTLNE